MVLRCGRRLTDDRAGDQRCRSYSPTIRLLWCATRARYSDRCRRTRSRSLPGVPTRKIGRQSEHITDPYLSMTIGLVLRMSPFDLHGSAGGQMIMRQSDVTCPKCHADYRRIELVSRKGRKGQFHCMSCDHTLEVFDGSTYVAIRQSSARSARSTFCWAGRSSDGSSPSYGRLSKAGSPAMACC
jgi:hypothetical protein